MIITIKIILYLAMSLFLHLFIEKKYGLGKKIFANKPVIKIIIMNVVFLIISSICSVFIKDFLSSYLFVVLASIYVYLLTAIQSRRRENY